MLRVVVDANILISGLFFDKNPEKLLLLGIDGKIKIIVLNLIISEVDRKIEEKFSDREDLGEAKDFWFVIQKAFHESKSDLVCEEIIDMDCPDKDDLEILEYTAQIKPDYFISGDNHVLNIKNKPFPIIGLRKFFEKEFPEELNS